MQWHKPGQVVPGRSFPHLVSAKRHITDALESKRAPKGIRSAEIIGSDGATYWRTTPARGVAQVVALLKLFLR